MIDGTQDSRPQCGIDDPTVGQGEVRGSQDRNENPESGAELSIPTSKINDLSAQLLRWRTENVERDDIIARVVKPPSSRGARNALLDSQLKVAAFVDQFFEAVIVGPL